MMFRLSSAKQTTTWWPPKNHLVAKDSSEFVVCLKQSYSWSHVSYHSLDGRSSFPVSLQIPGGTCWGGLFISKVVTRAWPLLQRCCCCCRQAYQRLHNCHTGRIYQILALYHRISLTSSGAASSVIKPLGYRWHTMCRLQVWHVPWGRCIAPLQSH